MSERSISTRHLDIVCVAFDFDGTLVDSNAIKRDAFFEVLRGFPDALKLLDDLLKADPAQTRQTIFSKIAHHLHPHPPEKAAQWAAQYIDKYGEMTETMVAASPEIPGAVAEMDRLSGLGYKLALVSATPTQALNAILERRGWANKFCAVYGAPSTKAQNLHTLSKSLDISARQIVMVGDRDNDFKGAAEFGCRFIGLIRPDSDFKATPHYAVNHLAELNATIQSF